MMKVPSTISRGDVFRCTFQHGRNFQPTLFLCIITKVDSQCFYGLFVKGDDPDFKIKLFKYFENPTGTSMLEAIYYANYDLSQDDIDFEPYENDIFVENTIGENNV